MSLDLMDFIQEIIYLKKKDGTYVINLDEYSDAGTHWVVLYCEKSEIICFYRFWVEHVTEEMMDFIGNKNLKIEIFRAQASDSIMCGCFCIGFIDFMLAGEILIKFIIMFSPYDF